MSNPAETEPIFFDHASLSPVDNRLLVPFTTTSWAEMSMLFVDAPAGKRRYPHFADVVEGYIPNCENGHPLRQVEDALNQQLYTPTRQPLRELSYCVGQITALGRDAKPQKWEREAIAKAYEQLGDAELAEPERAWQKRDFSDYYAAIRVREKEALCADVSALAGIVATQNQAEQLYTAKQSLRAGTGWLAPLVGLAVDSGNTNDYSSQIHDVIPVVRQGNGEIALLWGADAALYTAYAPRQGA